MPTSPLHFWPIRMLNWLVTASKLHNDRAPCCTAVHFLYCGLIHLCHVPLVYFKSQHLKYSNYFSLCVFHYVSNTFLFYHEKKHPLGQVLPPCPPLDMCPTPLDMCPPRKSIPCSSNVIQYVTLRRKFICFWLILCRLSFIICRYFFFLISCRSWKQN